MTNEEVIRYAKDVSFCSGCPVDFSVLGAEESNSICSKCEHRDFFETVVRMAEKQIPKKPLVIGKNRACPSCATETTKRIVMYWEHYCPDCGQAIDWEVKA